MKFQVATCAAVLLVGVFNSASGYSSGAPNDPGICMSMQPKHPGAPQNEASPYGLSVDRTKVKPGDRVTLTIDSPTNKKIKGFLVQGRNSNFDKDTTPVGSFVITDGTKGNSCSDIPNSSITHGKNDERDMVNVTWVAPEKPGTYVLLATIVQDGLTYWIRQPSQTITVA